MIPVSPPDPRTTRHAATARSSATFNRCLHGFGGIPTVNSPSVSRCATCQAWAGPSRPVLAQGTRCCPRTRASTSAPRLPRSQPGTGEGTGHRAQAGRGCELGPRRRRLSGECRGGHRIQSPLPQGPHELRRGESRARRRGKRQRRNTARAARRLAERLGFWPCPGRSAAALERIRVSPAFG